MIGNPELFYTPERPRHVHQFQNERSEHGTDGHVEGAKAVNYAERRLDLGLQGKVFWSNTKEIKNLTGLRN